MAESKIKPLDVGSLRRSCDPKQFKFSTTDELPDVPEFVGQVRALTAADFGIKIHRDGFNIFALGPVGIGKRSIMKSLLATEAAKRSAPKDVCYIHNS